MKSTAICSHAHMCTGRYCPHSKIHKVEKYWVDSKDYRSCDKRVFLCNAPVRDHPWKGASEVVCRKIYNGVIFICLGVYFQDKFPTHFDRPNLAINVWWNMSKNDFATSVWEGYLSGIEHGFPAVSRKTVDEFIDYIDNNGILSRIPCGDQYMYVYIDKPPA